MVLLSEINTDFTTKLQKQIDLLIDNGIEIAKSIVFAIIAYYIGKFIIKHINRLINKYMERRDLDPTARSFVSNIVSISLKIVLFIAIIGILGVKTSSVIAMIAGTGFGIGLALSGTMQNFANGILLLIFRPYRVGDYIQISDQEGTVRAIQIFHTIITTVDNKTIYIPNGTMGSSTTINYTQEGLRRVDITVGTDYGEKFERVKDVLMSIAQGETLVLSSPAPVVVLSKFADSSVDVTLKAWVKNENYWAALYTLNEQIYAQFNAHKIEFPYPQITISNR